MNYNAFISGIRFRFIKPFIPLPDIPSLVRGYHRAVEVLDRIGMYRLSLELINTRLPGDDEEMKSRLRHVCRIPKMSTFAIGAMINRGVSQMSQKDTFVNIGVWHGFTFLSGLVANSDKKCIGVDNFSEFGGPRNAFARRFDRYRGPKHEFYDMDYRHYFSCIHDEPIGFYLYDGDHSYDNQLEGLCTAEPFFSGNCIILIDDTNYDEPRRATMDFISRSRFDYRILLDRTTCCNSHPTYWNGILVIQKIG
jgi:hypothetical protein